MCIINWYISIIIIIKIHNSSFISFPFSLQVGEYLGGKDEIHRLVLYEYVEANYNFKVPPPSSLYSPPFLSLLPSLPLFTPLPSSLYSPPFPLFTPPPFLSLLPPPFSFSHPFSSPSPPLLPFPFSYFFFFFLSLES